MKRLMFKEWFFTNKNIVENIEIKWGRDNAILSSFSSFAYEFSMQWEDNYSRFFIGTYQAKRPGYISIGSRPTHIGIIKNSPTTAYSGVESGFLKNLIDLLKQRGYKSVPYREVGTSFDGAFKKAGIETDDISTGYTTGDEPPDYELGQSSTHGVAKSISVSRATGSWAQFFEISAGSEERTIKTIVEIMKKAAEPLIRNNLIDFIEIQPHGSKGEVIYSDKGGQTRDDFETRFYKSASQLKYFAEEYLSKFSKFKKELIDVINKLAEKASPMNYNISIDKLHELNNQSYAENYLIRAFLVALEKPKERVEELEILMKQSDWKNAIFYLEQYFWNKENFKNMTQGEGVLGVRYTLEKLKYVLVDAKQSLNLVVPDEIDYLENFAKGFIENEIEDQAGSLSSSEVENALKIANVVGVSSKTISILDQLDAGHKERISNRNKEIIKSQKEALHRQENLMTFDTVKYLMMDADRTWKKVGYKYLDNDGYVYTDDLAYELIGDDENIRYSAIEKAEEEAHGDVEERPSESYGQDESEVDDDIKYDVDDFVEDFKRFEDEEAFDGMEEDEIIDLIKEKYRNEFVKWKIEKLKEDEEENSYRYEPDLESHDFQMKVYDIQRDLAGEEIWDKGLVLIYNEEDKIMIQMHEKYWTKFQDKLKETVKVNHKEKTEFDEPNWKRNKIIEVEFMDSGKTQRYLVNDFI
jgi:hypothetical protein